MAFEPERSSIEIFSHRLPLKLLIATETVSIITYKILDAAALTLRLSPQKVSEYVNICTFDSRLSKQIQNRK